ncbi:MAG: hypothetical protein JO041_06620 [Acidobacteria bacterium]|nr:hypothetical protein [Acidobacteriota bacterium]
MQIFRRVAACLALLASTAFLAAAQVTPPEQFFGFRIGADKKLARWDRIVEYMQQVSQSSDRVRFHNVGPTTNGNPFVLLEISSPENIRNLDRLKALERKLYFQGGQPSPSERDEILHDGKAVVIVTNNIHSTEIGSSQMVLELVYQLATDNSQRIRKILDNVVLLLVPSLNPDGQIMVTDWYNKVAGTAFEATPLPRLYHPYVGHDNNRDMYLFSQKESRMAAQILWHDWFPAIWLDEHQQGSAAARIFTMPATDPINPNVDPLIYRLNTIYGQQQAAALEAEGRTGIIYNSTYTNFWQGAMAWSGWWHNQVGLLTEVASARIATPVVQQMADPSKPSPPPPQASPEQFEEERNRSFEHPDEPLPPPRDVRPRTEYPRPWLGGTWRLRDIVDYELTATRALLEAAADSRATLLQQIYDINLHTVEAGARGEIGEGKQKHYAVLIPAAGQHDGNEAIELVDKLRIAGVEVYRAVAAFDQDGNHYAAGTFVVPLNQVFGRYAKDLIERQTYPEVRRAPNAPAEAPYDVSAWSLGMQFGVNTSFAVTPLAAGLQLENLTSTPAPGVEAQRTDKGYRFLYNGATSAIVLNRLLKSGVAPSLCHFSSGEAVLTIPDSAQWQKATSGFAVSAGNRLAGPCSNNAIPLKLPRVALYQTYMADNDEGWTRWVLERYELPYTVLHNADLKAGMLRDRFDAIIIPDQRERDILNGYDFKSILPEYRGGIGDAGWGSLREFLSRGGTIVALGESSNLLIDKLPLPVKELKHGLNREQHFAPGTIVNLQVDTFNPIGYGVAPETFAFYINSPFFELANGFSSQKVSIVARYPNAEVNASGWLRGEDFMRGRAAVVSVDMQPGKVVLFGIRPQHRAQTHATIPLLFNSLYWAVETP